MVYTVDREYDLLMFKMQLAVDPMSLL